MPGKQSAAIAAKYSYNFSISFLLVLLFLFLSIFYLVKFSRVYIKEKKLSKAAVPGIISFIFLAATLVTNFIQGSSSMLFSTFSIYFIIGALIVSILMQVFKKTIGSLVTFLVLGIIIMAVLFLRSLTAFTGSTKIAIIRVLDQKAGTMTLQIEPVNNTSVKYPSIIKLKGERFGVIVYNIIFSDLAVFFGAKTRYAWLGMTASTMGFKQTDLQLFKDFLNRKIIFEQIERNELRLPFIKSAQASVTYKIAITGKTYYVFIENDDGVSIRPEG